MPVGRTKVYEAKDIENTFCQFIVRDNILYPMTLSYLFYNISKVAKWLTPQPFQICTYIYNVRRSIFFRLWKTPKVPCKAVLLILLKYDWLLRVQWYCWYLYCHRFHVCALFHGGPFVVRTFTIKSQNSLHIACIYNCRRCAANKTTLKSAKCRHCFPTPRKIRKERRHVVFIESHQRRKR